MLAGVQVGRVLVVLRENSGSGKGILNAARYGDMLRRPALR
jgi:hypothetical protein